MPFFDPPNMSRMNLVSRASEAVRQNGRHLDVQTAHFSDHGFGLERKGKGALQRLRGT
jgi:hypothetical protein